MIDNNKTRGELLAELTEVRRQLEDLKKTRPSPAHPNDELEQEGTDFRTLMEGVGAAILVFQDTRILYANSTAGQLTGYSQEELLSLMPFDLLASANTSELANELESILDQSEKTSPKIELKLIGKSGQSFWVDTTFARIAFEGQPAILATAFNITERKQTEAELRASEERFRQVVLSISDHIYVTEITKTGRRLNLYISPHASDLTGYSLEKFTNDWSFWPLRVIHPDDKSVAAAQADQLAHGHNGEAEYRLIRANGQTIWVRDSGKVHYDEAKQSRIIYGVVSDITERKRLAAQLLAIYQFGQELNLFRNEEKIFKQVLETTVKVLHIEYASYALVDYNTNVLTYRDQLLNGKFEAIHIKIPLDEIEDISIAVVQSGQAIMVADVKQDQYQPSPKSIGWSGRSQLYVPIKTNERATGLLNVASSRPDYFTTNDLQILQTLADQAATAVENARLYREIEQKVEELASMQIISQTITSTLNLNETLTVISDHTVRMFNARSASLALYEIATSNLWAQVVSGDPSDAIRDRRLPMGRGVVGWVFEQGDPLLIPDVTQDARFAGEFNEQFGLTSHSILCYPLQTHSGIIGVIKVISEQNFVFSLKDLRLLSWLVMPAVTAIENARLYETQRIAREQAEILRQTTSALTSTLDSDRVLESILIYLEQVVPYDSARIFLREDDTLRIVAGRGNQIVQEQLTNRLTHSVEDPFYQKLERIERPLILRNAQTDIDFRAWGDGISGVDYVRGWMGVPLTARNKLIGYLVIDSHEVAAYDQTHADLAQAFANQAALAIQNAQLFEQVNIGRNRLQSLSYRLVEVQESERRYVARELHDEAGQALASLMVGLRLLENEHDSLATIRNRVAELKRTTEGVSENLHRLAMNLHPAALDFAGLVAALRRYVESFGAQQGMTLQFETVGINEEQRMPPAIETNIYRIVQEALANVARHAEADQADVILERRGEHIIVIIEDNGKGFDPETRQSGRLGLLSMRERAEMIGGKLEIESAVGSGTAVYVEIPYDYSNTDC